MSITPFFFLLFISISLARDYKAVDELDLNKYIGLWYEVYQDNFNLLFQNNGRCSTAKYDFAEDNKVSVFNKQITNDKYDTIAGYAYYKNNDCCGYLTVQLKGTPEAPYWVLDLGPIYNDLYDYAIVSDDKALSLFVLTRDVERFFKLYNDEVLITLNQLGFSKRYNTPTIMNQTDCEI